ncbi:MAG TPA: M1 family metallopeptidase [Anaerolineaceae bacterium]|nr:M1 family metallopeptidase [Anaerolineaceae bacterium]HPN52525.1 M1 family metallopeptidase [Anaerolineaceae bacterium]
MKLRYTLFLCLLILATLAGCVFGGSSIATQPAQQTPAPQATQANQGAEPAATAAPNGALDPSDLTIDPAAGLIQAEQAGSAGQSGLTEYRIDLRVAGDLSSYQGRQLVKYTNREDKALEKIIFRLFPNTSKAGLQVDSVKVDGKDVTGETTHEQTAYEVNLPQPLEPGKSVELDMIFSSSLPLDMGGNYGLFGFFEDVLVMDQFYPVIPVFDDEGWNVENPPPVGDLTYNDISRYIVRLHLPSGYEVAGSGSELSRKESGSEVEIIYALGLSRDFYFAASAQFTVISELFGETKVTAYTLKKYENKAKDALKTTIDAMRIYSERFGSYPYTELDVLSTPMQALGMEYPGLVDIALMLYDPNEKIGDNPATFFTEATIAHEVAHQWFYSIIGSDQVDEPWVDEAITQYATGLYYLDMYGPGGAEAYQESWYQRWDRTERAEIPVGMPSANYEPQQYSPIVYGRGPIFLKALEEKLGQEKMNALMKEYTATYRWKIGTAAEFRALADKTCGCDLSELFNAWVGE